MSKGSKNKTIQENSTIQEYPDGRNYDATAVRNIAQEWIDKHMKNREQEFTKGAECSVFCGTWNVNAKKQEGGLQDWLLPNNQQTNIDVYAIGFQEIVDLNAVNVALNSNNTQQRAQFWEDKINECLEVTGTKYRLIGEKYLVGLLLCIYVKESLLPMIRDVRMTSLGVGIMGMMGNKGGVSIRFSIYDSTIVFICSHLAAHRENVIGRNNDFKNIYEKSLFYVNENNLRSDEGNSNNNSNNNTNNNNNTSFNNGPVFSPTAIIDSIIMPRQGAARYYENNLTISDHDIIFWMGDLNYRIDDSIIIEDIFRAIEKNDLEILRQKDQLNIERLKNRVFQGFQEGVLTFAPTYKYQPGTDVYETRAEKKLRAPAWCDRILWKIMNKDLIIKLIDYRRSNLLPSDHKPVSGNYHVTLKEVVENKEKIIFNELMSFLKKYPSKELPILEIKGLKINFDKVLYEIKKESIIEMKNIGESMAFWHFVPKMEESVVCKKWITLDKESGLLLPGESVTITATIFVDSKTAHVLNAGKDLLQDVLILRIENSNDYYVDIKADYERSCFGMSLEDLIQFPQPISDLPLPAANPEFFYNLQLQQQQQQQLQSQSQQGAFSENMTSGNNNAANVKLSIPKELWRIIDALWAGNALREKDLFNTPGDTSEISQIRYALDHGLEFNFQMSPHSLADCLIHFLNSLPKPLLPMELYPTAEIDPMNMRSFCRKFLEDLPTINYNVFVYLISFFREVLAEESYNRCTAEQLSSVCVQCMTSTNGTTPSTNDDYFIDFSDNLTKEEKEKRLFRQSYVQQIIFHLLTTNTI